MTAKHCRALVVDNEGDFRLVVGTLLKDHGWQAEEAASGQEALERCERHDYDIVLMDQRMPGMTGLEAARVLRERTPHARIVLFTAWLNNELEESARRQGVTTLDKLDLIMRLEHVLAAANRAAN